LLVLRGGPSGSELPPRAPADADDEEAGIRRVADGGVAGVPRTATEEEDAEAWGVLRMERGVPRDC
jgi:hypothetical protein